MTLPQSSRPTLKYVSFTSAPCMLICNPYIAFAFILQCFLSPFSGGLAFLCLLFFVAITVNCYAWLSEHDSSLFLLTYRRCQQIGDHRRPGRRVVLDSRQRES
jgi:hypothetical protein